METPQYEYRTKHLTVPMAGKAPHRIDGALFEEWIAEAIAVLAAEGFELVQVLPLLSGASGLMGDGGFGYSYTSDVVVIARRSVEEKSQRESWYQRLDALVKERLEAALEQRL